MRKLAVMVFGVFDALHPGHIYFLKKARLLGGKLIVVVARDTAARKLKAKRPRWNERTRAARLRRSGLADRVTLGDREAGEYGVIRHYQPDILALGYDQRSLGVDLRRKINSGKLPPIKLKRVSPHHPRRFHSSILAGRVKVQ